MQYWMPPGQMLRAALLYTPLNAGAICWDCVHRYTLTSATRKLLNTESTLHSKTTERHL
jgi:hypothetical protein